jgi:hypothetical protein
MLCLRLTASRKWTASYRDIAPCRSPGRLSAYAGSGIGSLALKLLRNTWVRSLSCTFDNVNRNTSQIASEEIDKLEALPWSSWIR